MDRTLRRDVAIIVAGAFFYLIIGWWSLRFAHAQANASAVWCLAGLGIGALARFGLRFWPAIFLGALANNLIVHLQQGVAPTAALVSSFVIALGNTGEALLGARLARGALGVPPELRSASGVVRFVLLVALLPPLVSAGGGAFSLYFTGLLPATQVPTTAVTWFSGNVAGIVTCAPLFFLGSWRRWAGSWSRLRMLEMLVLLLLLITVGQTICGVFLSETLAAWPKSYMAIPLVLWLAFRFGRRVTVLAVLLLMGIGIAGTVRGYAAFPAASFEQSLLSLLLFIVMVAVVGLTVAVLVHELRGQRDTLAGEVEDRSLRLRSVRQEKALLTASAIHELQSPLSGVRNVLHLVRAAPELLAGPEGLRLLGEIDAAVERMFTLVTSALAEERRERIQPAAAVAEPCDLGALVGRVVETELTHAEGKGIALDWRPPALAVIAPCHALMIEHITGNFVSNAVKFSRPGTRVQITVEDTAEGARIAVADAGPGISEADRRAIFSGRITHRGATPTGSEPSAGLGLYLAGRLAERAGARLACEPAPGGGSIFSVSLGRSGRPGEMDGWHRS